MKYVLGILLVILAAGCVSGAEAMVEKGDRVFVHYTGTLEDGTVFDSSEGKTPLEFDAGVGRMISGFDAAVMGMKVGEEKTVRISAKDAYGPYNESLVISVPKSSVPGTAKANDTLYTGGRPVKVVAVGDSAVIIDVNHPLAGKDLTFRIKMVKIEKE